MTRFYTSLALANAAPRLLLIVFAGFILAGTGLGRSIYLNGIDISNARNQSLEGVDIRIDAEGNVFIIGNHYEIYQQQPVAPLVPKAEPPGTPHKSGAIPELPPKSTRPPNAKIVDPAGRPPRYTPSAKVPLQPKAPVAQAGRSTAGSQKGKAPSERQRTEDKRPL